jgi:hypothetical protein
VARAKALAITIRLILNGIIHLDADQADVFYVVMGVICSIGSALLLLSIRVLLTSRHFRLSIGDEIRLPGVPLWKHSGEVAVPAGEVVGVEMHSPQKPRLLVVVTGTGRFPLPTAWLPEAWSPREVADRIVARAREARGR